MGKVIWIISFSFIWWATLLNNSSYDPHGTYVLEFTFLLHQGGPKRPKKKFHFCHGDLYELKNLTPIICLKNPAYGRQSISWPMRIVSPTSRSCLAFFYPFPPQSPPPLPNGFNDNNIFFWIAHIVISYWIQLT